ncbi:MAG: hypothetical protein DHS80DRAFT_29770 [Piptocephalis tieghemiana]|nr:MAG: hypothetical protein DHS80DRAFT_29770 [Piptocephalis tieghemiana]
MSQEEKKRREARRLRFSQEPTNLDARYSLISRDSQPHKNSGMTRLLDPQEQAQLLSQCTDTIDRIEASLPSQAWWTEEKSMMEQAQHTIPHLRKIREVQTAIRQDATAWTAQVYEASVRACLLARDARELHVSLTRLIHHIYPRMHRSMDKPCTTYCIRIISYYLLYLTFYLHQPTQLIQTYSLLPPYLQTEPVIQRAWALAKAARMDNWSSMASILPQCTPMERRTIQLGLSGWRSHTFTILQSAFFTLPVPYLANALAIHPTPKDPKHWISTLDLPSSQSLHQKQGEKDLIVTLRTRRS